ncbi:MAG: type II glyceraldehyde-3-phosphate dehydrogenase [archaeon]
MSKIRVLVDGAGTVGERVADAITLQPDMELVGVTKNSPSYTSLGQVHMKGYKLFSRNPERFGTMDYGIVTPLEYGLEQADVVVCCLPGKYASKVQEEYGSKPRIFQGGENADSAEVSFVAAANYDKAIGKNSVRVVSCNTTALSRVLSPFYEYEGQENRNLIKKAEAVIVRRVADPHQVKGLTDQIEVTFDVNNHGHHGADVKTIMPNLDIYTMAVKAPTATMHQHNIMLKMGYVIARDANFVREQLAKVSRVKFFRKDNGFKTTAQIMHHAQMHFDPLRRGMLYEVAIWEDSIMVDNNGTVRWYQAIDQQSIVVPENIDAIRAMFSLANKEDSMRITDETLRILGGN